MMEVLFHDINPLSVPGKDVEINQTAFLLMTRQFMRRFLERYPFIDKNLRAMAILIKDWIDKYIEVVLCR